MADEFPSNVLPWQRVARETGAEIMTVAAPLTHGWTEAIMDAITPKVRVVALSQCHWTNGALVDLTAIGEKCQTVDAPLVVDATQSLGAVPFPIETIKPDFLIAAGYKWLLGPYGFALLHVGDRWRNARPLEESWLARLHAEDFAGLVNYSDAYMSGARRFDVGEKCVRTILPGAIAALEQIKEWGVPRIAESLSVINDAVAHHLLQHGFEVPDDKDRSPHMFGARLPSAYQGDLVGFLRKRNIYISQRGNSVRFAPHLHITNQDIKHLLDAIDEAVG
jgi:selenocysteine lyase/cysteine desulfurase